MQKVGLQNSQSLCSTWHSSGRMPKVSIGITVEKARKPEAEPRKEEFDKNKESVIQDKVVVENNHLDNNELHKKLHAEASTQKPGQWTSTKSVRNQTPTTEAIHVFANKSSVLRSENGAYKKSDTIMYGKKRGNGVNDEIVEEVAFASIHEMQITNKSHPMEAINTSTAVEKSPKIAACNEALKMKLWEVLGTTPPQNKLNAEDTASPRVENQNNYAKQDINYQRDQVAKPFQNSDPIETESESPNQTVRRPLTRSLSRKIATTKALEKQKTENKKGMKPPSSVRTECKWNPQEKSIFTFDEVERNAESIEVVVNGRTTKSTGKKIGGKKIPIEPRKICFSRRSSTERSSQSNGRVPKSSSVSKASSKRYRSESSLPCQRRERPLPTSNQKTSPDLDIASDKHLHGQPSENDSDNYRNSENQDPKKRKFYREYFKTSPLLGDSCHQKTISSPQSENTKVTYGTFPSPTLAMDVSFHSERSEEAGKDLNNPAHDNERVEEGRSNDSGGLRDLRPASSGSDVHAESSEGAREISETYDGESSSFVSEKGNKKHMSSSPIEDKETESLKDSADRDKIFSGADCLRKSPFLLRHSKRVYNLENLTEEMILPSPSLVGSQGAIHTRASSEPFPDNSEQFPENGLARAVLQLAFVLEKFKTKHRSNMQKKRSDILMSVTEEVRQKLHNVESQIQDDVKKFLTSGKCKRSRLESRFREQHEKLRLVHDKFKEELNHHILGYRSSLEELVAYQMELKDDAERQKASHKKLLMQLEETTKAQLSDAATRITVYQTESRQKMNSLRHVLKDWIGECGDS